MTDKTKRKLVKSLATGGGIIATGAVPGNWTRPVIDSVILPVHARSSVQIPEGTWEGTLFFTGVSDNSGPTLKSIGQLAFNALIPPAHACLAGNVGFRLQVIAQQAKLLLITGNVLLATVLIEALLVKFLLVNISGQLSDIFAEYLAVSNTWKMDILGQNDGFACLGNDASGILTPVMYGP